MLEKIHSPRDLDGLSYEQIEQLAGEIRRELISTGRANILALRYDEPGISNLVSRLYGFTGETNACLRVLSGEARISITNYLEEISHSN